MHGHPWDVANWLLYKGGLIILCTFNREVLFGSLLGGCFREVTFLYRFHCIMCLCTCYPYETTWSLLRLNKYSERGNKISVYTYLWKMRSTTLTKAIAVSTILQVGPVPSLFSVRLMTNFLCYVRSHKGKLDTNLRWVSEGGFLFHLPQDCHHLTQA